MSRIIFTSDVEDICISSVISVTDFLKHFSLSHLHFYPLNFLLNSKIRATAAVSSFFVAFH